MRIKDTFDQLSKDATDINTEIVDSLTPEELQALINEQNQLENLAPAPNNKALIILIIAIVALYFIAR